MTLEDLWKIVRRYWTLILASVLVFTSLAAVYTLTRTPTYTASASAFVVVGNESNNDGSQSGAAYSNSLLAQQKARNWVPLATSGAVAQRVIGQLKLKETPQQLANNITATLTPDTTAIMVTAVSSTPQRAQQIANSIVTATGEEAKKLEGSASQARINLVSSAQLPSRPSSPRPERNLPIGAALGGLVGLAIAVIRRRQDTRLRGPEDVEKHTGASVLAVVPETKGLASESRRAGGQDSFQSREALRQLRTNLRFVDVDHTPRSIVVSSARMGEGKSTTAANLARVLADSGEPVLLIDADLRRPSVAGIFDLDSSVGLTQVLAGTATLADAVQAGDTRNLSVLTAGQIPPNPSELLGSNRMEQLLEELTTTHLVILDAPPLLPVTDAALLTASADGALLVVAAGETREEQVSRAVQNVRNVGGRVLGCVLNRVNTKRLNRIVYGESQYGYGAYGTYGEQQYGSAEDQPPVTPADRRPDIERQPEPAPEPQPVAARIASDDTGPVLSRRAYRDRRSS